MPANARRTRLRALLTLATTAACLAALASVPAEAGDNPTYTNPKAPIDLRVKDLLKRMTLDEKIGQMDQISVGNMQGDCQWSGGDLTASCMKNVLVDNATGSVLSGGGGSPAVNTPESWANMVNTVQKYALDNSRLHIPIIYGVDAVHGHNNVVGATIFPQQIGMGSTWDPALVEDASQATARAVAATGIDWNFAPVADIARDTRWGRYYETYGEDPLLSGTLAAASVTGTQNADGAKDVAATVKHFAAYGEPGNGHDRAPGDYSLRYLQDTLLPSYKQAIDAGAMSVMVNSGAINGIPATSSQYLLTDVLRKQWGFQGVVVSDWADVKNLQTAYHIAADYPEAIAEAVNAGVDMAMEPYDAQGWSDGLKTAVDRGLVSVKRIDQSVTRILKMKFELGLFEHPYVDASKADDAVVGADTDLAQQAAAESQVLLRNDGNVLPISSSAKKIVVAGSYADDLNDQVGGWTVGWQGVPSGVTIPGTTVLEGIKDAAPSGTEVVQATTASDAVTQAQDADLTVVVVGEKAAAEGAADSPQPELSADQQALVKSLKATGKPVVTVVIAGRPLALGDADGTQGLLASWLPGTEGGKAVADVLFGEVNPSGRLNVSWPKEIGNEPEYYQLLPGPYTEPEPSYPFGAGLSYTTYDFSSIKAGAATSHTKDTIHLTVGVSNSGDRAGDLVVPVYVTQPTSEVLTPSRKLVAFTRVHLDAGQSRTVSLNVPPSQLALTPGDINGGGKQQVEKGAYVFTAGNQATTVTVN